MEFLLIGMFRDTHFALQENTNPQSKQFGIKNLPRNYVEEWHLKYSGHPKILPTDINGENFAKGTEDCKILGSLMGKEMENLEDQDCAKVQDVVDEEKRICLSCSVGHKTTLPCAQGAQSTIGRQLDNASIIVAKFVLWNILSVPTNLYLSKWFNLFFKVHYWEI